MNREELIKEIDNATRAMRETTRVVNETLCHSRHYKSNEETEEAYNKGLDDVWKLLKAFCDMEVGKRQEVFGEYVVGKLVENMSPQKALAKLEAYEKSKEIKVGDVVDIIGKYCTVTQIDKFNEMYHVVWDDGGTDHIPFKAPLGMKKTSKHIDISTLLEQLRGE